MNELLPHDNACHRADRQTLRERERKSREKRVLKLARQRTTLELYERVVAMLPSLEDEDNAFWESVLDEKALQIRARLQRMMQLTRKQRELEHNRLQLSALIHEHRMASIAIENLLGVATNDWETSIRRWRGITRRYFKPWAIEDCLGEIETSQKEVNAFLWSLETEFVGVSFFGWRVRRRFVGSSDTVQFSFEKTFRGSRMIDFVNVWWDCLMKPSVYEKIVMNNRGRGWMEVLQEFTPDMVVTRCIDWYPSIPLNVHMIYLGSRVKTDTGYTVYVRSLFAPEVQKKTDQLSDMWASNFVWHRFEALNDDGTEYRARSGGVLSGRDPSYAAQWVLETLGVLLRGEWMATKQGLLSI